MKFPYRRQAVTPSPVHAGVLYRPMVPLRVIGPAGDVVLWAVVDTGADQTVLPRSVADKTGVAVNESQRFRLGGFTGDQIDVQYGEIGLQLARSGQTIGWSATVGFVTFANPENEVALLGHSAGLDLFRATFHGEGNVVELVPLPHFPGEVTGKTSD